MPRILSARIDLAIVLGVILIFVGIFSRFNPYFAMATFLVWLATALLLWDRQKEREKKFLEYCENVVGR